MPYSEPLSNKERSELEALGYRVPTGELRGSNMTDQVQRKVPGAKLYIVNGNRAEIIGFGDNKFIMSTKLLEVLDDREIPPYLDYRIDEIVREHAHATNTKIAEVAGGIGATWGAKQGFEVDNQSLAKRQRHADFLAGENGRRSKPLWPNRREAMQKMGAIFASAAVAGTVAGAGAKMGLDAFADRDTPEHLNPLVASAIRKVEAYNSKYAEAAPASPGLY